MNEERMLKPAVIGGVLVGILSSLPLINLFNCVCCAWVIGGGILASYLYVKDSPIPVTLGRGMVLGLLTGAIGSIVTALFSIPLFLIGNRAGRGLAQIRQALEQLRNVPPDRLRALSEKGGVDVFFFAAGLVFILVTYSLVAMVGGAIGVAVFEKRKPAASPTGIQTYEPPQPPPPPPPPDAT
jgi:hypothetical protein